MLTEDLQVRAINTIRFLSADGVQKANSGHPGLPMGAAANGFHLVDASSAPQSAQSQMGWPRSICFVRRTRFDVVVFASASNWL